MADIDKQLSLELTRIIDCPYPASLSHLADLLTRADVLTIRACIHNRAPCAVSSLVTLVCEALSQWAYALRILSSLCESHEFRDTVLIADPGLLNALLTKAISSPREFDEYARLCVLLLSRPLPASVPLPASAQSFFVRVFEKASRAPDVSTLKPVYSMLNGACRNLLTVLPLQDRQQFDQELAHILSLRSTGQNSMLLLWCFGIVLLAEYPGETSSSQNLQAGSVVCPATATCEKQWRTASGRKLFGSTTWLYKTINLAYLSVIWATKGDVGVSDEEAIEGIRIAICTLRNVDQEALRSWPYSSPAARNTFTKLPLKLSRVDINPTIQFEALCFYAMIAGEGKSPADVVAQYELCLTQVTSLADTDYLGESLSVSLPVYSLHMQHNSLDALVAGILEACVSPSDSHQLLTYTVLVEQITAALPKCASLQTTLLSAVSSTDIQAKIWKLVQIEVVTEHATCYAYTVSQHQQMVSAMIALLLTLALAVQLAGNTLPLVIITALISKQRQSSHVTSKCSHEVVVVEPSKISLFQQKNTPYTGQHLQDWRGRLKSELESQGFYQRDSIVRSVAQICQDLETRCNTVEEPLRWEKERSQELEHQIVGLRERVASLEIQAADDRFHSEGLEDEKLNISDERDCLSAKLKQLEVETSEATRKAADSLRQVHEEYNAKEMELRSTILIYEESIRAHEEDAEAQNNTLEELRERLQHVQDQRTALSEQHVTLQHRLYDVEEKLGKTSETTRTQAEEIVQFKDRIQELELQLQGTKTELDTITTRLSDLKINHQELIRTSEEAYRYLEDKYTCDMEIATTKAKDDYKTFNARLQEAFQHRKQAENAHDTTRQDLQLLQTSIPPLEAKIQELTTFCAEQEEELDELRTLRKNVLASFGYASQNPLAIRSSSRTQKDAINPQTPRPPREHRRRKSAIQTLDDEPTVPRGAHSITSTAMENIANASFVSSDSYSSQNGSTPKRSKPRPSFKVPAIHTPYTQKPILASRSISKKLSPMKRSALRQMSPNRRHTIVGFAVSENEEMYPNEMGSVSKRHGSLQGVEEADFDTEEFLGGTPMTPENFAAGTGRVPDNDYETTTEL